MHFCRAFLFLLVAAATPFPMCAQWRPVDPADLALSKGRVDPDAPAEALFHEVRISNEQHGVGYSQNLTFEYVRLKIFKDTGKELANVQIPYFDQESIFNVQGRTIQPNGAIVALGKEAIFDKVINKRGTRVRIISFAMPAVETGSIIEYQFTRNEGERTYRYKRLDVQSSFPVEELTYKIKPLYNPYINYPTMRFLPFGCAPQRLQPTRDGFEVLQVRNIPTYYDEPFSPPRYTASQWILLYYEENSKVGKDQYWNALGKELDSKYKLNIKVTNEVKAVASKITAGASSDVEKLDKLLQYCRTELKDLTRSGISAQDLRDAKENKNSADTLEHKQGTAIDINFAFLALAQAAGFDAHRAELSERSTFLFDPMMQSRYFLNAFDIAVKVNGQWRFYDVTNRALPGGELRWQEQGVYALVLDGRQSELVKTPILSAAQNRIHHLAKLSISENGTLEGEVRELRYGTQASLWREDNQFTNDSVREEDLREELKERFADFKLSDVHFSGVEDPSNAMGIVYHISVPNYAQRTGRRLFIPVNYFQAGASSRLTETTRHNPVYFRFPWTETDIVDLKIPDGFVLENPDAPGGVNAGNVCAYNVKITFDKASNHLTYTRNLIFGNNDWMVFDKAVYANLKKVFDAIHSGDSHMLTVKAQDLTSAN